MIKRIFQMAILALLLAGLIGAWWLQQPLQAPMANVSAVEVTIDAGSSSRSAAINVAKATGANSAMLATWFRLSGKAKLVKAGTYSITPNDTPYSLLNKLVLGEEILHSLTIPEGWTFKQMRAAVDAAPNMKHTTTDLSDAQLMSLLGQPGQLAEGRFFPDTYSYAKNSSDLALYKQSAVTLEKRLQAAWDGRDEGLPLKSPHELLTLASIVEKETGKAQDRAEIAGVFINRLRLGMLLQTDPTVIYGMGERFAQQRGNIRKSDLTLDTPYNTYTRAGLPPGPIALVGKASLQAAAKPKATSALYFVARGDGSSEFSATLAQHNAAVNRYIRGITP